MARFGGELVWAATASGLGVFRRPDGAGSGIGRFDCFGAKRLKDE
jgi:hypothetical protein